MVSPGEIIISESFDSGKDVDLEVFQFRKEAHHEVADGVLKVIPPVVAYKGKQVDTKWAKSSMTRCGPHRTSSGIRMPVSLEIPPT